MVRPITFSPRARSIPATTELSTPPDMATASGRSGIGRRQLSQMRDGIDQSLNQSVHLLDGIGSAKGKAYARASLQAAQPHGQQNVRWLRRAAGTGRAARDSESLKIQGDQQCVA